MKQFITILLAFFVFFVKAQNTMYFMESLPQNTALNPAIIPDVKFYYGQVGLNAQVYNSGFTYNQFDKFAKNLANINYVPDDFVNSIGESNLFLGEVELNLFSLGFKLKDKGFLSFSATMNSMLINEAASDIAYLLTDLDDISPEDFPIVVDGISLIATSSMKIGFTYAHKINDHLTLGISPRVNFSQAGLKTSDMSYKINMVNDENEEDIFEQTFSGLVEVALPTEINSEALDQNVLNLDEGLLPVNWTEELRAGDFLKNPGLLIDFGATYEIEKWTFSASVLNLGNQVFKTNVYKLNGNNNEVLLKETNKIKIQVPTRVYLGASRQFSPKWNYALLLNNHFYSTGAVTTATASLNGYIGKMLSTSVSYTAGYKYDNLGLGLRLRFLPGMDLYAVTDNIIQAVNFKNANRLTAAVGLNFAILGHNQQPETNELPAEIK